MLLLATTTHPFSPHGFRRSRIQLSTPLSLTRLDLTRGEAYSVLKIPSSSDTAEVKRAYRKLALKYHPDVNPNARDQFDAISEAYKLLTDPSASSSSSSSSSSSTSSRARTRTRYRPSSSSSSSSSTDWRDYMNDPEDQKYETDDSFSSIFSDLLKTGAGYAASYSSSSGGILNDLVDFLEDNVESFSSYDDNDSLSEILSSTDVTMILAETEETQSVVTQLQKKAETIQSDLVSARSSLEKLKGAAYSSARIEQEIDLTSQVAGLEAKEKVVSGHLKRSRKRLVALQERSKELLKERRARRGGGASVIEELEKLKKDLGL
ncbi:hypothetical protein TrVE_jg1589 [Triparma verrucosa]|uniref:J domain-containing protein n=1 Tax=Triparma verrucosa TaxID=1606542 RepID=A0A9W7EZK3_9STRA|nr:hypothetical protein TrVE_jg1589 [Triparma verrucosa]